jgi:two-component system OmpR family response regulator
MLIRIPNVLSPAQVEACRSELETANWTDGKASAGSLTKAVKNNMQGRGAKSAMRILVIEDDIETADYLVGGLADEGHAVSWSGNCRDGLFFAMTENFDLLIVDRMLPELDGLTLVKTLRAGQIETPVLCLTTMAGIDDRVTRLNAGGDDFLVKPFAFSELVARVKALSWRPRSTAVETHFTVADLELDLLKHVVKRGGNKIQLQPRDFRLLEYLMRHAGHVVTRTMLLSNVWNRHFDPRTNVVESHLCRLRTKIDKGFTPELIHTVRGAGYCLRTPE